MSTSTTTSKDTIKEKEGTTTTTTTTSLASEKKDVVAPMGKLDSSRMNVLSKQLSMRSMDRATFQKRFVDRERGKEAMMNRGQKLSALLNRGQRPSRNRLKGMGVIKELAPIGEITEEKEGSDSIAPLPSIPSKAKKKDLLEAMMKKRPRKDFLLQRNILLSIDEGEGDSEERKKKKEEQNKKLASLLMARPTKKSLQSKGIIVDEDERQKERAKREAKLKELLGQRTQRGSLTRKGILKTVDEAKKEQKQSKARKEKLGAFIAIRPSPMQMVDRKIMKGMGAIDRMKEGNVTRPKQVELKDAKISTVGCGWSHTVACDEKGLPYAFGNAASGRLGNGTPKEERNPTPTIIESLQALGETTKIHCGDNHAAAIVNKKLYTWGQGNWGVLGLGAKDDVFTPSAVDLGEEEAVDVVCGAYHTVVLTASDKVFSFGWNKNGRLGVGKDAPTVCAKPIEVKALAGQKVNSMACSQGATIVSTSDGKAFSWGLGAFYGLGHGVEEHQWTPKQIEAVKDITSVACGVHFALALSKEGKVYSWGQNKHNQLGRVCDEKEPGSVGVIEGIEGATEISAGKNHSLLISKDGQVYAWGKGLRGVLGNGSEDSLKTPTLVEGLKDKKIVGLSANLTHSAAVTADGELYTWGNSQHGKLGYNFE